MKLLDSKESQEFIQTLEDNGFGIGDWEYLQDLLEKQGLDPVELQDKGLLEDKLNEIIDQFAI